MDQEFAAAAPSPSPEVRVDLTDAAPIAVVGVGASAGGLEALETFFSNMPVDAGLAFVVVQHLSPDFKSLMDELLGRYTRMPVHRVEDGMPVQPNSVYVIPPGKEMIISNGKLLLRDKEPHIPLALPIDMFFRSLASDLQARAVAVVLSGTGSDGSRGLREVHDAGGLVMVQAPETAKFDGMPRSAIETGLVDLVLPVDEMSAAIQKYLDHARMEEGEASTTEIPTSEQHIESIIALLRGEYGIDFRHYKPNTLRRRIERRLLLNHTIDLETYVRDISNDRGELHNLYKDLLIGVTRFFRDRDAFERIESEVLPQLLAKRGKDEEIRVWVAGCATGEEAYSIAILIHEQLERYHRNDAVKIFATDVHRASLELAATGIYDEQLLSEVSAARRERHFRRVKDGYQVCSDIRRMVVFAPHDVIKDAPFTRLDLVTCRNLLIYFDPLAQKKVLSLFHFGLKAGGVLFMGPSETPGELQPEFDPIDRHWKIFRKKRDVRLPPDFRMPMGAHLAPVRASTRARSSSDGGGADNLIRHAQDTLVQAFVPASILVDVNHQVMHTFSGAGRFLTQPADGRASLNVLDLVETELKLTLNGALHRVAKERQPVTYSGVRLTTPEGVRRHRVMVRPVDQASEPWFAISLEPEEFETTTVLPDTGVDLDQMTRERIASLERELQYTRENLQATLEEMETANEELQATNEELVASNEELQSTNEELHSVNEELYTVNSEHQAKIRELTELTEDMENLFAATDVGTIFLDRDLCVRKFTPQIARTFHLLPQDVGRKIDNFAHSLNYPELVERLTWVLKAEKRFETQVEDRRGAWFLLRVVPYVVGNGVQGVVVNLVDITGLKSTERQLARMSKVFMDGADPILIEDLSGRITDLNHEAERVYGWNRNELVGQNIELLMPAAQRPSYADLRDRCRKEGHVRNEESSRCHRGGNEHPVLVTMSLLTDEQGKSMGIATIAKDISRQKQAENDAHTAVRRRDEFLAMLSHELRNPLAAAQSACTALLDKRSSPQAMARAAGIVHRQTSHMARLLEDLLDVSRVVQGKITIQSEPTDLARTTMEAVEALQGLINSREQRLTIAVDPSAALVIGDRARLRQVQENLLSNASRFTPRGGSIDLSVKREGDQAVVRVRDTGRGIANNMQDSIFELFTQVGGAIDRTEGGMGIGLTMVRHLVQLHGGTVTATSDGLGKGSEFVVRLPAAGASDLAKLEPPPTEQPIPAPVNRRVLIIEDNPDAREALAMVLELEGFRVASEPDGERGLSALVEDPPEVALVDIGLPGLNGFDLAKKVRERFGSDRVRLVALTGYGSHEDRRKVREAGFDAHLVKPVTREALRRVLVDEPN